MTATCHCLYLAKEACFIPRHKEVDLPTQGAHTPDWLPVVFGLLGGLALFLYGLRLMTDAVKAVAGGSMRIMLARLTRNRFTGALTGAFVTAVIQSSSVTTVLLVGFVSAGLMTLQQSVGVIMGANIGSTVTAQIIAFKVTDYALLMIAIGYAGQLFVKRERVGLYGTALLGMGVLFLGMSLMSDAASPLRSYEPFLDLMRSMRHPLLGIAVGTLFTALVQSSAATTGIVIVLAGGGMITLEAGIALALGANIGTCATAMLAAIGKPREAIRAAVVHVLFNVMGVLVWLGFLSQLASLVRSFGGEVPRQIANAHTVFNIVNTVIFIGLTGLFAAAARALVPDRRDTGKPEVRPKFLDEGLLDTPSLAIQASRFEIGHAGGIVRETLGQLLRVVLDGREAELNALEARNQDVERLYAATVAYVGRISRSRLTALQLRRLTGNTAILNHVQNVALTLDTNMVTLGRERIDKGVVVSKATEQMFTPLYESVKRAFELALEAVAEESTETAEVVIDMKDEVNTKSAEAKSHLLRRLSAEEPNRAWTFRVESDLVENLKRLYYFSKRIAKAVQGIHEAQP